MSHANTNCVRDHLWIWAHEAGSHDKDWGTTQSSRMTPLEGAVYLDVPNLMLIRYEDQPEPPFDQYAVPFRALQQVVWSVTGAAGATSDEERRHVLDLARRFPNITGVIMDDFFHGAEGRAALSVDELKALRDELDLGDRRLDLTVIFYDYQLDWDMGAHLQQCDRAIFWTWEANNLARMETNFERFEAVTPGLRRMLGCYMYDYGTKQEMPLDLMEKQCETGLPWLREGRIEGMVFLASCICDLELEAVEWTRRWIAEVGYGA